MSRKRVLYYMVFNPYGKRDAGQTYVIATYTDGSTRKWYPGDLGYRSAKAKAMRSRQ